jgi:phi LC3 family holin
MKINWKVRIKNKTWLASALALLVAFVFDVLALMEIAPAITQDNVMLLINTVLTILGGLGVIVDPTTPGAFDSDRAMLYDEPGHLPDEE